MSLNSDDHKWLLDQFEGIKTESRAIVKAHEARYHPPVPPGRALRTIATIFGIGAAGITIAGGLLAALYFLVRTAPK